MDNAICFRSNNEVFWKEKLGLKPNTLRKVDKADPRFELLIKGEFRNIRITNNLTGDFFSRNIKDVTLWEGWVIISWEHKDTSK